MKNVLSIYGVYSFKCMHICSYVNMITLLCGECIHQKHPIRLLSTLSLTSDKTTPNISVLPPWYSTLIAK